MNKNHLTNVLLRAFWRLKMTWHYLLAIAIGLVVLTNVTDWAIKNAVFLFVLLVLCFTLMDVPLEEEKRQFLKNKNAKPKRSASKQNQNLSLLIEALPNPIMILTRANTLLFANEQARLLFNINQTGQDISAIIRTPDFLEAITTVAGNQVAQKIQLTERVPIARQFTVQISSIVDKTSKVKKHNNHDPAIIIHFYDLTEQERLNRMRSDFIANASHELRTPLASLLGFIETLQGPARDDEAAREKFLGVMATQGKRMTGLIDDLLSLSRIEMNAHKHPQDKVEITTILRSTVDILAPLAKTQNITLDLEPSSEQIYVIGNQDELAQVFQNLVHNAIKYGQSDTNQDNTIKIRVEKKGPNKVCVEVQDHGIGIDPVHIPRLTERFYRVDVEQSREKGGTGLGLAIAKHIITQHRGELKIRSSLGQGSTFSVILPSG